MAQPPSLQTDRLILRPFLPTDAPRVTELVSPFEIADTTATIPHPYAEPMADDWIRGQTAAFEAGEHVTFAVTLARDGELIGAMGLRLQPYLRSAELGYWVGMPYWSRGYATEAARAVIAYAFGALDVERVHANHLLRNPASGRVLEKAGMRREGILRHSAIKWDRLEDLVHWSILREEWPGRR